MKTSTEINEIEQSLGQLFNDLIENEQPPVKPLHDVAIYLLAKSMRTWISLKALAEKGMAEDMAPLVRSVYENAVTLEYLHKHAHDDEVARFIARAEVTRAEILRSMRRLGLKDERLNEDKAQEIFQQAADVRKKYLTGYSTNSKWDRLEECIRKSLGMKPKKQDPSLAQKATYLGKGAKRHYQMVYKLLSSFTHPDAYAAVSYIKKDGEKWRIPFNEPNYATANAYASQAAGYILIVLREYNDIQRCELADSRFEEVLNLLAGKS